MNHSGRLDHALKLVQVARECGADAVKFQAFTPWRLCPQDYERQAMLKGLALTEPELSMCAAEARRLGIEFMCTPMDEEWLDFCVRELKVKRVKVGSGQNRDRAFLKYVGDTCMVNNLPIIVSSGMANNEEFQHALHWLTPSAGIDVTALYCVSEYPTPDTRLSMEAMTAMRASLGVPIGYSSHSPSIWPTVAAVYAGATVTENHIALPGVETPDYSSSLQPEQLRALVREIRYAEARTS